jgi:hypothetical protein
LPQNFKTDEEEWNRMRKFVLRKNKEEIIKYVESGSKPLFGYPPVCFSPTNKKRSIDEDVSRSASVLKGVVLPFDKNSASVSKLLAS